MRKEAKLGGFGGQGIIIAGYILGKAATIYDKKEAVFTQSYGPEARGGACSANVVISNESIDYPMVIDPDYLVLMSQEAFSKYSPSLTKEAILIVDEDLVKAPKDLFKNHYKIPATRIAEELGKKIVANIVMLGYFIAVSRLVTKKAARESIRTSVPAKFVELNLKAFEAGYRYARKVR